MRRPQRPAKVTLNLRKRVVKEGLDLHLKQNLPKEPTQKPQQPRKRRVKEKLTPKRTAVVAVETTATEPVTAKTQMTRTEPEETDLCLGLAPETQILKMAEPGTAVQVMEIRAPETLDLDLDLAIPGVDLALEILARAQAREATEPATAVTALVVQEILALVPEIQTQEAVVAALALVTMALAQVQEQAALDLAQETGN